MSEYYLQTENLAVGYDGKFLIRDIAIGIRPGEIVTMIGPNGSGKSTILKTITKQLQILSGNIILMDNDLQRINGRELASKMAIMLTERVQPEMMTCYDVAAMGRYPYTGRLGLLSQSDRDRILEALELVGAMDFADRRFGMISDGQRQRILLARAICQEPDIIILDEPTSFLDIHHKLQLLMILKKMAKEKNIAVLMSLHEIDLAQKISDRIIGVKGDRIACYGSPEEIFKENIIRELYDIDNGFYNPWFGSIELPKVDGVPKIFVISSGGSGIPVYRKLQRQNIPFSAGILYENDIDFVLAKQLAVDIVVEKAFSPISEKVFEQAAACIEQCEHVINAGFLVGPLNARMTELIEMAQRMNKLI